MSQESIEQQKKIDAHQKALLEVLENIQASLRSFFNVPAATEIYTKEERKQRHQEYRQLLDAHREAQEAVRATGPHDGLSWKARVEKYGEEKARELSAPIQAAFEVNRKRYDAVNKFEQEHKILLRFWECSHDLSRSKWE